MGYVRIEKENSIYFFRACDRCGFVIESIDVYSLSIPILTDYMREHGWYTTDGTKENNWTCRSYCAQCASALGYINDPIGEGSKVNEFEKK